MCIFISTVTDTLPLQLSDASGVPYYRQVQDQLAALIRSGALPAGAALPSVRRLAVELKVSVITTRRAYADLEAAGLVHSQQGRGTFVAEVKAGGDWAEGRVAELMTDAVRDARELGLEDDAIRAAFQSAMEDA